MLIIPLCVQLILMLLAFIISCFALACLFVKTPSYIIILIFSILFGILVSVLVFGGTPIYEEEYDRTINLYALDSGNGVKGIFLLGGGTIHDVQYYIGYTNTKEDDYMQVKFDASNSVLRLKDDEIPRAEIYKQHGFSNFFDLILVEKSGVSEKAILYIPRDGLKNEYSVNY